MRSRANVKLRTLGDRVSTADTRKVRPQPKVADPFYTTAEWKQFRDQIIAERGARCENPRCRTPRGPWGRVIVDHIVELRDGGAKLDRSNVQILCYSCHTQKTMEARAVRMARPHAHGAVHPSWLKPSLIPLVIVCGPPASGKSTYVSARAGASDLVLDLDTIAARLAKRTVHEALAAGWLDEALRERNRLLVKLAEPPVRWPRAWLIVSEPLGRWRQWWRETLRPEQIVVLVTPDDVCLSRIARDPQRATTRADISGAVMQWWNDYTPLPGDLCVEG